MFKIYQDQSIGLKQSGTPDYNMVIDYSLYYFPYYLLYFYFRVFFSFQHDFNALCNSSASCRTTDQSHLGACCRSMKYMTTSAHSHHSVV